MGQEITSVETINQTVPADALQRAQGAALEAATTNDSLITPHTFPMNGLLHFYADFTRRDDNERIVEGYCYTTPTVKGDKWNLKRAALEAASPAYMELPCVRAMHQPVAAGKGLSVQWDDKGCLIRVLVVDDDAWKKVQTGVYRGFSIGGRPKLVRGAEIESFEWIETSLVDRPCDPGAVFTVARAEAGATEYEVAVLPEGAPDEMVQEALQRGGPGSGRHKGSHNVHAGFVKAAEKNKQEAEKPTKAVGDKVKDKNGKTVGLSVSGKVHLTEHPEHGHLFANKDGEHRKYSNFHSANNARAVLHAVGMSLKHSEPVKIKTHAGDSHDSHWAIKVSAAAHDHPKVVKHGAGVKRADTDIETPAMELEDAEAGYAELPVLDEDGTPVADEVVQRWDESQHPRGEGGKFGSGGAGGSKPTADEASKHPVYKAIHGARREAADGYNDLNAAHGAVDRVQARKLDHALHYAEKGIGQHLASAKSSGAHAEVVEHMEKAHSAVKDAKAHVEAEASKGKKGGQQVVEKTSADLLKAHEHLGNALSAHLRHEGVEETHQLKHDLFFGRVDGDAQLQRADAPNDTNQQAEQADNNNLEEQEHGQNITERPSAEPAADVETDPGSASDSEANGHGTTGDDSTTVGARPTGAGRQLGSDENGTAEPAGTGKAGTGTASPAGTGDDRPDAARSGSGSIRRDGTTGAGSTIRDVETEPAAGGGHSTGDAVTTGTDQPKRPEIGDGAGLSGNPGNGQASAVRGSGQPSDGTSGSADERGAVNQPAPADLGPGEAQAHTVAESTERVDADLELQRANPNHADQPRDEAGRFAGGAGGSGVSRGDAKSDAKGNEQPKGKAAAREAGSKAHKALSDAREHLSDGKSHSSKEVQGALETAKGHLQTAMASLDVKDAARAGYQAGHATIDDVAAGKYPSGKGAQAIMALKSAQLKINNAHKAVARADAPETPVDAPAETPADDVTIVTNESPENAAADADNNAATTEATADEIDTALQAEIAAETPAATERAETNLPVIRGEAVQPMDEPLTRGVIHGLASRFSLPSGARDALLIAHTKGVLTSQEHVLRVIAAATDAEYVQRGDWTKAISAHGVGGALEGQPHRPMLARVAGWDESAHPRAKDGKFGSGGAGGSKSKHEDLTSPANAHAYLDKNHGLATTSEFHGEWDKWVKNGDIHADNAKEFADAVASHAKKDGGKVEGKHIRKEVSRAFSKSQAAQQKAVDENYKRYQDKQKENVGVAKEVKLSPADVKAVEETLTDHYRKEYHTPLGSTKELEKTSEVLDDIRKHGTVLPHHHAHVKKIIGQKMASNEANTQYYGGGIQNDDTPLKTLRQRLDHSVAHIKRADTDFELQRGQTSESVPVRENLAGGSTGPMKGDKPVTGKVSEMKVYRHDGCPILHLTAEDAAQCDNDGTVDRMEAMDAADVARMAGLDAQPMLARMEALAADNTMLLTRAEQAEQLATQNAQELTTARVELETTLNRLSTVEGDVAARDAEINTLRGLPLERRAVVQFPAAPVARGFAMNQMVAAPDVQRQQEVADALQRAETLKQQAMNETNASKRGELVTRLMSANLELNRLGITVS